MRNNTLYLVPLLIDQLKSLTGSILKDLLMSILLSNNYRRTTVKAAVRRKSTVNKFSLAKLFESFIVTFFPLLPFQHFFNKERRETAIAIGQFTLNNKKNNKRQRQCIRKYCLSETESLLNAMVGLQLLQKFIVIKISPLFLVQGLVQCCFSHF